jgi:hypothetical protein
VPGLHGQSAWTPPASARHLIEEGTDASPPASLIILFRATLGNILKDFLR